MIKTNNFFKENLEKNKTVLAPLAGVTNLPFRLLCKRYGANLILTEMISAKGLIYENPKTNVLLETISEEAPIGVQIFGSEANVMARAVKEYLNDTPFDFIDINMGCPVKKVVSNNEGSALLKDVKKISEIVREIKKVSKKPVSAKIRLGWDSSSINAKEVAKALEESGIDLISVHGRTREQMYEGKANWEEIGNVKAIVKVPVVGNGDIFTPYDAKKALEEYKVDGVMIARGAIHNPMIFSQINDCLSGKEVNELSNLDKIKIAREHFDLICEYEDNNDYSAITFRKYLGYYTKGMKNGAKIRRDINKISTIKEVYALLDEIIL